MKIQRLITISAICLSMSLAGRAQVIDDFLRPGPRPQPERCEDHFESFRVDHLRELRGYFDQGDARNFYRRLSLSPEIKPGAVSQGTVGHCYGLLFFFVAARPTGGQWTEAHREMLFHLFDMGFDPNERIKNTPTTSGGADHTPVIARFGESEDLTLFNLYSRNSTSKRPLHRFGRLGVDG